LDKQSLHKLTKICDYHVTCETVDYLNEQQFFGPKNLKAKKTYESRQKYHWTKCMFELNLLKLWKCTHGLHCEANFENYLVHLCKIRTLCDEVDSPNIFTVGEFNAGPKNMPGLLLSCFCSELELHW